MEVEMKIRGLMMDPVSNMPIVLLKDVGSDTVLPIWVGVYEANAIALEIEKVSTPRPMTHDLIKSVLTGLDALVHKVVVTELKDDTFYAVIWLEREGHVVSIDSRPSDALALALRVDCPIFVEDEVLKNSKQAANSPVPAVSSEELRKWLEDLGDDDLGIGISGNLSRKCYGCTWRRIFEGVHANVEKHLAKTPCIGSHIEMRWNVEMHLSLFLCHMRFNEVHDTLYHVLD